MNYTNDLERARVPVFHLGGCRDVDYESETLDFHHLDLSGASLECYISDIPGSTERLAVFPVTNSTETQSYQTYIDQCRFDSAWIPCGETNSDMMTSSSIVIRSARSSLQMLPRASEQGQAVELYYALRQTSPETRILLAGKFYLTETVS